MEPREANSLSNQVLCMIAEYHLTGLVQGSPSISPVLPEVAEDLLPPTQDYLAGGRFQGTRITAWLHRLDMATDGAETTSWSLEAAQHRRGPLLDLLLAPKMSSLTFAEVVECVLAENRHRVESLLDDLQGCRAQLWGKLDDLIEAQRRKLSNLLERGLRRRWI